ncbi:MAG: ABC transporter ATP-binding protein [Azospirillaceae bacterium]
MKPIFELSNLTVEFRSSLETVTAVHGLDLVVNEGESFAIVGESGSGKTVSMMSTMRLLPSPPAHVTADVMRFDGRDLSAMGRREWRHLCGERIAMVFQDALTALNPVYTVGWQIGEMFRVHRPRMGRREIRERTVDLLGEVGIPEPAQRVNDYPHQFSGGMRQRAMIAMAIALEPAFLIADEPTTALDVTVQAQLMDLLARLKAERGMSMILITHDLGLVSENADRVAIMYAGSVMETGAVDDVLGDPRHPYTLGLLASRPQAVAKGEKLTSIQGSPPNLAQKPQGCPFHPRCRLAEPICRTTRPLLLETGTGHGVACHAVNPPDTVSAPAREPAGAGA